MQTLKRHKTKIYMIIIILLFQVVLPLLTAMVENSFALTTVDNGNTKELLEAEYSEGSSIDYDLEKAQGDTLPSKFSLLDIIPDALPVKDQGATGACWAFASIAALETSIALRDYYNGFEAREYEEYDFSERHLEYATTRDFADGEKNTSGYARTLR